MPKSSSNLKRNAEPGDIIDIPYRMAMRWIERGTAAYMDSRDMALTGDIANPSLCLTSELDYIPHKPVSIVIPVFDALNYLQKCLDSLISYTRNYELIIIDNGSGAETSDYLRARKAQLGFILQTNKENMGFSYACNQGIKLASHDYICFLNSDTMVSVNWLGKLMRGFDMPDAGIVGPSSCFCAGKQMIRRISARRLNMSQYDINQVKTEKGIEETEIYGFCYLVARKVIDDIGVFDVNRYPIGGAEEKDFSWRATKAGYKSYWVKDSYVHHFGNQTFKQMGIRPVEPRRKNDAAFEKRKSDPNIYIPNTVKVEQPPIPILMIVLDRHEYTQKALESVLANTRYPFKLFIFNNGSAARTTRYLESLTDSRIEYYHSRENIGLVPAMNMFFDRFKDSKYVAKVDNDTVVSTGWLGKLKTVMDAVPLFTLQANHYLAMPFEIKENDDFYQHCFGVKINGSMLYLFKNSGGTGQIIRRQLIDSPIPKLTNTKGRGGLSGWCNMQVQKYKYHPSGFYTGVWVDRLDQIDTNKYKPVSDYPEYDRMIKKMRPWGLGYSRMDIDMLQKVKGEMEQWYSKNAGSLY